MIKIITYSRFKWVSAPQGNKRFIFGYQNPLFIKTGFYQHDNSFFIILANRINSFLYRIKIGMAVGTYYDLAGFAGLKKLGQTG